MTGFLQRSARYFFAIRAAEQIRNEIEKEKDGAGNLKTLVENGRSVVGIYLNGCSAHEKARIKRDLNTLRAMGITPDMILTELTRQMPELAPIIAGKEDYKRSELQALEQFSREG